jgi:DNA-binding MarR family transcriptional regulator
MKQFTMKSEELKLDKLNEEKFSHELARDEQGRLYSVRMRQLMGPLQVDMAAVEALGAMRMAGRMISLLHERWAEKHGLTEGRLGVMFRLFRCGPTPLGELADDLETTPRNITGLVDHLERDGLVERVPDPDDRRSVRANLTAAGKERIEGIWKEGLEHQFEMTVGLSKDELAQLRHLCLLLVENARKELGK